jgi:L-histidine Nalpha-methyltransferase
VALVPKRIRRNLQTVRNLVKITTGDCFYVRFIKIENMAIFQSPLSGLLDSSLSRLNLEISHRLQIETLTNADLPWIADDGQDVIAGLGSVPKTLPAKYFYDDRGSHLFEAICDLPEYYVTRTEHEILENCADELAALIGPCDLIELGSGSSLKTQVLLEAYGNSNIPLRYLPIDVSGGMLKNSSLGLLEKYPKLDVYGLVGTYDVALASLPAPDYAKRLILFLGSSLGNLNPLECDRLFSQIADALNPGEYFLLGVDLQKPVPVLEAAYNDSQGVTADFNLNMLHHLNWRFSGNFCPTQFEHQAVYNIQAHQIEMYLTSLCNQSVRFESLDWTCQFQAQEKIRTEISRKFELTALKTQLQNLKSLEHPDHQLQPVQVWTDPQQWFALVLSQLQPKE